MSILAWLGLTAPPDNVTVATHEWLAADRDARAEVSAREQLPAWQCRAAAARLELRERNRMYGRASATIGRLRAELAQARVQRDELVVGRVLAAFGPVDEQRGADEALAEAMQRHPSGTADPADTAKVGDPDPTVAERAQAVGESCDETYGGFVCTRAPRHDGQHVAGTWTRVAEAWPNDADAVLVATAERLGDEIGRLDQTAAVEGAAITLRAHTHKVLDSWGSDRCSCGWTGADHPHHVAEQLAAVGALGGGNSQLSVESSAAAPVTVGSVEQLARLLNTGDQKLDGLPAWAALAPETQETYRRLAEYVLRAGYTGPSPRALPAPRPTVRTGSFRLGPARGLADGGD